MRKDIHRNPRYFFAVFGEPSAKKPAVESGRYLHKGYISHLPITAGDVMLLYCTSGYRKHIMEAPGVGIVVGTTEECVYYQYFPLDRPVGRQTIKESLKTYENRLRVPSSKGNWLFQIDNGSFSNALKGTQIAWP